MNNHKINILFVAFEFPPLGGAGVQRSLKFVKYLPAFGIRPIVVTVKEDDYAHAMPGYPIDKSLAAEITTETIIERIHCKIAKPRKGKIGNWASIFFSTVENFKELWKDELERVLPKIIEKYNPSAIYVSLPPFAMAPLWEGLSRKLNLPLIVDFRDAWSQWCVAPNASIIHYWLKLRLEKKILQHATSVICSTNQIRLDFQKVHPHIEKEKFNVINNGYDSELNFSDSINISYSQSQFVIGYVGSFYYSPESREQIFKPWWQKPIHRMIQYIPRKEDWLYRSPYFFFKALRSLFDENPGLAKKIEIRFAGKTPSWLRQQILEFGLEDICKHYGYLNHEEVILFQHTCDALLITSAKVLGGRDYSIAGKTYEYLTIGKPILGFVCEGDQKDILEETGSAILCDPDNTKQSAAILKKLFTESITLKPNKKAIEKFHRKYLSSKLANLVHSIIQK